MTALRQRMIEDLCIRNFSPHTQGAYIRYVRRFAEHFRRSPLELGPEEIREFQVHLVKNGASYSTLAQVVGALRFLYRVTLRKDWAVDRIPYPKPEHTLPTVLSRDEVEEFLGGIRNLKHRAILTTCYAAGLRVSEVCGLRIEDIDSARMVIHVRQGKGRKDRLVPLSENLLQLLREHWRRARPETWLFPGQRKSSPLNPRSVQKVCRRNRRRLGFRKEVTPHTLRHSFANRVEDGVGVVKRERRGDGNESGRYGEQRLGQAIDRERPEGVDEWRRVVRVLGAEHEVGVEVQR